MSAASPALARKSKPATKPEAPAVVATGPMTIVVSIRQQRVAVFRGQTQVDASRVSTGQRGYRTPTGVFTILQKNKWHRSNLYSNAPMPYMQRITWSGVALHQGIVPGYPASHGCIRLQGGFARKLFGQTKMGAHVIVTTDGIPSPHPVEHAALFQQVAPPPPPPPGEVFRPGATADASATAPVVVDAPAAIKTAGTDLPNDPGTKVSGSDPREAMLAPPPVSKPASSSPLRMFITQRTGRERLKDVQEALIDLGYALTDHDGIMGKETAAAIKAFQTKEGLPVTGMFSDALVRQVYVAAGKGEPPAGHLYVRQDFQPIYDAVVGLRGSDQPLGAHLFTAQDFAMGDLAGKVDWMGLTPEPGGPAAAEVLDRIEVPEDVRNKIGMLLTPGSSLLVADGGFSSETGLKGTDFIALTKPGKKTLVASTGEKATVETVAASASEQAGGGEQQQARPVRRARKRTARRPRRENYGYYAPRPYNRGGYRTYGWRLDPWSW